MTENALNRLFRHESYYLKLPSGGKFYSNPVELSVDGELGIMPMTAADEIKLKSPDALFNGESMYQMIASCVPGIKNPKEIPIVDIDAILIAIRMAGGDETIEVNSVCPKCETVSPYEISLTPILQSITLKEASNEVELQPGVTVYIRPYTLETQIKSQTESFYQYQMQKIINGDEVEAAKEQFEKLLAKAINLQIDQLASAIVSVRIEDDNGIVDVTDQAQIREWVSNMSKKDHTTISSMVEALSSVDIKDEISVCCPSCQHEYKQKIELNPVNFF